MKLWLGIFMISAGVVLGLYLGIWVMFIGGIVQIVNAFKTQAVEALPIGIGMARIFFAAAVGWFSASVLIIPGGIFIAKYLDDK